MSSVQDFSLAPSQSKDDKIVVIVGGIKHETYKSTLMSIPGSRLAKLVDTETPPTEICFDRHPEVFTHVLQYYRSGKLHCPTNLCGVLLEEEFAFWGVSGSDMEPCCWVAFHKNRDAVEALAQIDPSVMEEKSGQRNKYNSKPWQLKLWALFDDPYSSIAAKVIAVISLLFILLSITVFALKTHSAFNLSVYERITFNTSVTENVVVNHFGVMDTIELVFTIWFVVEFLIRLASCPSKPRFFINVLNIVDLLALFPWLFDWFLGILSVRMLGFLHVMRCLRLLRVFKLMQHVLEVRVLICSLRASAAALCTVPLALFSCTIIFGTMAYYAERLEDESYQSFTDIPCSFWWAVVTLTTVGYGDIIVRTLEGQLVATLCAAVGVFLIVLPVPIIVNNFIIFYSLIKAKYTMPSKKEKSHVDAGLSSSKTPA